MTIHQLWELEDSMQLSPNFTYEEAISSDTATRSGIVNRPLPSVLKNMKIAAEGMELVRSALNCPIIVSSWFRSMALNRKLGSKDTSDHVVGWAIDFKAPQYGDPKKVCKKIIAEGIKFDQLIYEGTWVHISFNPRMRGDVLTAVFSSNGVSYKKGIV